MIEFFLIVCVYYWCFFEWMNSWVNEKDPEFEEMDYR